MHNYFNQSRQQLAAFGEYRAHHGFAMISLLFCLFVVQDVRGRQTPSFSAYIVPQTQAVAERPLLHRRRTPWLTEGGVHVLLVKSADSADEASARSRVRATLDPTTAKFVSTTTQPFSNLSPAHDYSHQTLNNLMNSLRGIIISNLLIIITTLTRRLFQRSRAVTRAPIPKSLTNATRDKRSSFGEQWYSLSDNIINNSRW